LVLEDLSIFDYFGCRLTAIRRASVSGAFLLDSISLDPETLQSELILTKLQMLRLVSELKRLQQPKIKPALEFSPCSPIDSWPTDDTASFPTPNDQDIQSERHRLRGLRGVLLMDADRSRESNRSVKDESTMCMEDGEADREGIPAANALPAHALLRDPAEVEARGEELALAAAAVERRLVAEARRRLADAAAAAAAAAAADRRSAAGFFGAAASSGSDSDDSAEDRAVRRAADRLSAERRRSPPCAPGPAAAGKAKIRVRDTGPPWPPSETGSGPCRARAIFPSRREGMSLGEGCRGKGQGKEISIRARERNSVGAEGGGGRQAGRQADRKEGCW
jgi:hypothetical protein